MFFFIEAKQKNAIWYFANATVLIAISSILHNARSTGKRKLILFLILQTWMHLISVLKPNSQRASKGFCNWVCRSADSFWTWTKSPHSCILGPVQKKFPLSWESGEEKLGRDVKFSTHSQRGLRWANYKLQTSPKTKRLAASGCQISPPLNSQSPKEFLLPFPPHTFSLYR